MYYEAHNSRLPWDLIIKGYANNNKIIFKTKKMFYVILVRHWQALFSFKKCIKGHLRKSKNPKIFWGAYPQMLARFAHARGGQIKLRLENKPFSIIFCLYTPVLLHQVQHPHSRNPGYTSVYVSWDLPVGIQGSKNW